MEFGRITDPHRLERIHWDLPPLESPEEREQLRRLEQASGILDKKRFHPPRLHIGTPVWSEPLWQGKLFPPGTKSENYLREYAKQFTTVEVNSTFYAIPGPPTFEKWRDSVPEGFRFCPKFPQTVSRSIAYEPQWHDLEAFLQRIAIFGERLGVSFLQLPQEFGIDSLPRLEAVLRRLPREARTMVEFRNSSFFQERRLKPEIVNLLAELQIGTVITDTALYRNFSHASLSGLRVLIRFASNNGHSTDPIRIRQWVERLRTWLQHGLKEVYLTVHGTDNLAEIEIARDLIRAVNLDFSRHSLALRVPEPVFHHEIQGSLF